MAAEKKEDGKLKTGSVIKPCNCVHPFQDAEHGKGMRVHTTAIKKTPPYECTVCKTRKF